MAFGVSTSCLYPLNTELSLKVLCESDVQVCELFFNSPGETAPPFLDTLRRMKDAAGLTVRSIHPWSSFAETHMLFSEYERRFEDTLEEYQKYFNAANILGADYVLIHGCRKPARVSEEEYIERFGKIVLSGERAGVTVVQENINAMLSQAPEFLEKMRAALGEKFKMTFDVKQAVRAGYEPIAFAKEFADRIVHVHISDHKPGFDCLAPGKGEFDFRAFLDVMENAAYKGDYIIELYRQNFGGVDELFKAKQYMESL